MCHTDAETAPVNCLKRKPYMHYINTGCHKRLAYKRTLTYKPHYSISVCRIHEIMHFLLAHVPMAHVIFLLNISLLQWSTCCLVDVAAVYNTLQHTNCFTLAHHHTRSRSCPTIFAHAQCACITISACPTYVQPLHKCINPYHLQL